MKHAWAVAAILCVCATSFAAVSYDASTFTLTYGDPSDLDAVIDPVGLKEVQQEFGMTKAAFSALAPQVVGFNTAPASFAGTPNKLVVQFSAADSVTFNFAAKYNWGSATSGSRGGFSGTQAYHAISTVETQPGNSWFDLSSITVTGGQGISALGFCVGGRSDIGAAGPGQAIFALSDNTTVAIDYPAFGGPDETLRDLFIGFEAPAGTFITGVRCTRPGGGNSYISIDDLAFVVTPEPATLALLGMGALMIIRCRR